MAEVRRVKCQSDFLKVAIWVRNHFIALKPVSWLCILQQLLGQFSAPAPCVGACWAEQPQSLVPLRFL